MPLPKSAKPEHVKAGGAALNVGAALTASPGFWPQLQGGSHMLTPYSANVLWQGTSSNATYCSASSALGGGARA